VIALTVRKPIVFVAISMAAGALGACTSTGNETEASGTAPVQGSNAAPALPDGALDAGRYTVKTLDPVFDSEHRITMHVPAGYEGADGFLVSKLSGTGQNTVANWIVGNVYGEACHWSGTLPAEQVASTVDGLVAALASQKGRTLSTPTDVEVDGFSGKYVEMTTPLGIKVAKCDDGQFRAWSDPVDGARWTEPGQRDLLWIIDVDGTPLVIDAAIGPDTTQQDRADRIQMVESIRIEPV
jgi:hypothetical protein